MGSGPGFINSLVVGAHVTRGPTPEPTGFSVHGIGASLIRISIGFVQGVILDLKGFYMVITGALLIRVGLRCILSYDSL